MSMYLVSSRRCAIVDSQGKTNREVKYDDPFEIQLAHDRGMSQVSDGGFFKPRSEFTRPRKDGNDIQATGSVIFVSNGNHLMEFYHVGDPEEAREAIL